MPRSPMMLRTAETEQRIVALEQDMARVLKQLGLDGNGTETSTDSGTADSSFEARSDDRLPDLDRGDQQEGLRENPVLRRGRKTPSSQRGARSL